MTEPFKLDRSARAKNCTIGAYTYAQYGAVIKDTDIGRYCSIAREVLIAPAHHSIDFLTTHQVSHEGRLFMDDPVFAAMKGDEI